MRENVIESRLRSKLAGLGLECKKFIPDGDAGMPDRVILLPDRRVVWVELKTDRGKCSALQKYQHIKLRAQGHDVRVLWNAKEVDAFVSEIEQALRG